MNFTQQAMEGRIMKDIAKGDKGLMLGHSRKHVCV